jgi:Reverse transcriptase (RNA-dependent DNA polymerase)
MDCLVSHLEHADDLLIFATQARALQMELNNLAGWARDNGMTVNPKKSAILIFTSLPLPAFTFYLGTSVLEAKSEYKYLGFTIKASPSVPILESNYPSLASKAASAGVIFFTMRAMVGTLRPKECLSLYFSLTSVVWCGLYD